MPVTSVAVPVSTVARVSVTCDKRAVREPLAVQPEQQSAVSNTFRRPWPCMARGGGARGGSSASRVGGGGDSHPVTGAQLLGLDVACPRGGGWKGAAQCSCLGGGGLEVGSCGRPGGCSEKRLGRAPGPVMKSNRPQPQLRSGLLSHHATCPPMLLPQCHLPGVHAVGTM